MIKEGGGIHTDWGHSLHIAHRHQRMQYRILPLPVTSLACECFKDHCGGFATFLPYKWKKTRSTCMHRSISYGSALCTLRAPHYFETPRILDPLNGRRMPRCARGL